MKTTPKDKYRNEAGRVEWAPKVGCIEEQDRLLRDGVRECMQLGRRGDGVLVARWGRDRGRSFSPWRTREEYDRALRVHLHPGGSTWDRATAAADWLREREGAQAQPVREWSTPPAIRTHEFHDRRGGRWQFEVNESRRLVRWRREMFESNWRDLAWCELHRGDLSSEAARLLRALDEKPKAARAENVEQLCVYEQQIAGGSYVLLYAGRRSDGALVARWLGSLDSTPWYTRGELREAVGAEGRPNLGSHDRLCAEAAAELLKEIADEMPAASDALPDNMWRDDAGEVWEIKIHPKAYGARVRPLHAPAARVRRRDYPGGFGRWYSARALRESAEGQVRVPVRPDVAAEMLRRLDKAREASRVPVGVTSRDSVVFDGSTVFDAPDLTPHDSLRPPPNRARWVTRSWIRLSTGGCAYREDTEDLTSLEKSVWRVGRGRVFFYISPALSGALRVRWSTAGDFGLCKPHTAEALRNLLDNKPREWKNRKFAEVALLLVERATRNDSGAVIPEGAAVYLDSNTGRVHACRPNPAWEPLHLSGSVDDVAAAVRTAAEGVLPVGVAVEVEKATSDAVPAGTVRITIAQGVKS